MAVTRNAGAKWFIPTENEWYKAAYFEPAAQGGDSDDYWMYPMKTNSVPYSDQPPGATPDNTRAGNVYQDDHLANGYDDGYAVCGLSSPCQNYLTDVGAYSLASSYYGTFDQAGNVAEWIETAISFPRASGRGVLGGYWGNNVSSSALNFGTAGPSNDLKNVGFRVASIPEPGTLLLTAMASVGLLLRRER